MGKRPFEVQIPEIDNIAQGQERFIVEYRGRKETIKAHDYDAIYKVPGLYEYLFYETYKCDSPSVISSMLKEAVKDSPMEMSDLKVLDVGAGNGMMGEKLKDDGAGLLIGVDIIEEAAEATERDRPGVYEEYFVEDLTELPEDVEKKIEKVNPNCMTVVAALGFDDMPPEAFRDGYNLITTPGWVAFNIKDEFLTKEDSSGFSSLINQMISEGVFDLKAKRRYLHRYCQDSPPLFYYAVVGEKTDDIPPEWAQSCNGEGASIETY